MMTVDDFTNLQEFGQFLAQKRRLSGRTKADIARSCNLAVEDLSGLEDGSRDLRVSQLLRLIKELDLTVR